MNSDRNTSETEIEKILRTASKCTPPAGLKERLVEEIPTGGQAGAPYKSIQPVPGNWLKRWWPALVPGAISAACAMVLATQHGTIRDLKANIQTLSQTAVSESTIQPEITGGTNVEVSTDADQEINRLKDVAARLKGEIEELQGLKSENLKLRAQIATPPESGLTAEEAEAIAKGKEKALSIACVNNLKQFGLAVRTWALDNNDSNPPSILSMSNELSAPKVLVCPADTMHQAAKDWSSFTMANCSYEFLVPDEKDADREPQRVSVRCPIHGHIGLCDGSVQSSVGKNHPDWLVERDGKLFFSPPNVPASSAPNVYYDFGGGKVRQQNPAGTNLTEEQIKMFQQRYGIVPGNAQAPQ
jgi:hypothetical protein